MAHVMSDPSHVPVTLLKRSQDASELAAPGPLLKVQADVFLGYRGRPVGREKQASGWFCLAPDGEQVKAGGGSITIWETSVNKFKQLNTNKH